METKNLGKLIGPLLIFGGAYSNLQALQKLQQIATQKGFQPAQIICTGDVVAYCAQPEETVKAVRDWGIHCIAGNVELNLREGVEDCGCNFEEGTRCDLLSKQWYPYAQSKLSKQSIDWMHTLPHHLTFEFAGEKIRVVHGSLSEVSGYIFHSTPWQEKAQNIQAAKADIILSGHCGIPFHDQGPEGLWLNAGVIGMPANDGTPRVWYLTLEETENGIFYEHHAFNFDNQTARQLMEKENLPDAYSDTLVSGIWDNCDILPDVETQQQGMRIVLGVDADFR